MKVTVDIKTMQLYNHIDRLYNELKERGILLDEDGETISPVELSFVDSLHYLGNEAIKVAIQAAAISADDRVLDVGSGLGGPARMLCHYTGCKVDAMELQPDLSAVAETLTARCPLAVSSAVHHIQGDFLDFYMSSTTYTRVVSWLVFLHIPDRSRLFQKCWDILEPGGRLYVEDFYRKHDFTATEKEQLQADVFVSGPLPTWEETRRDLEAFEILMMDDMTHVWTKYVRDRAATYQANLDRHVRVNGPEVARDLFRFYRSMDSLFQSGHLGGVRYCVVKPSSVEIAKEKQQEHNLQTKKVSVCPSSGRSGP